jgi:hypothetical protein
MKRKGKMQTLHVGYTRNVFKMFVRNLVGRTISVLAYWIGGWWKEDITQ